MTTHLENALSKTVNQRKTSVVGGRANTIKRASKIWAAQLPVAHKAWAHTFACIYTHTYTHTQANLKRFKEESLGTQLKGGPIFGLHNCPFWPFIFRKRSASDIKERRRKKCQLRPCALMQIHAGSSLRENAYPGGRVYNFSRLSYAQCCHGARKLTQAALIHIATPD